MAEECGLVNREGTIGRKILSLSDYLAADCVNNPLWQSRKHPQSLPYLQLASGNLSRESEGIAAKKVRCVMPRSECVVHSRVAIDCHRTSPAPDLDMAARRDVREQFRVGGRRMVRDIEVRGRKCKDRLIKVSPFHRPNAFLAFA